MSAFVELFFETYNIPPFKYVAICAHGKQRNARRGWVVFVIVMLF